MALPLDLQFTVAVELTADHAIVRFAGELDLASAEACRSRLEQVAAVVGERVVFDLSRLSFIDCAGASTLVDSAQRLSAGPRVRTVAFVLPPRGAVSRVFDLLQLGDLAIDNELPLAGAESCGRTRGPRHGRPWFNALHESGPPGAVTEA